MQCLVWPTPQTPAGQSPYSQADTAISNETSSSYPHHTGTRDDPRESRHFAYCCLPWRHQNGPSCSKQNHPQWTPAQNASFKTMALQPQCDFRPCNLFSGRFRFHHHNTERVPSGISLLLDVGDHRLQTQAQSSTDVPMLVEPNDTTGVDEADIMDDATALMQRPRYKAFPRPTTGTGPGIPPAPTSSSWFTISQPIAPTGTSQHQPVQWTTIQVRNLADFHTMLQWLSNRAQQDRCQPDAGQAKIATWYLHPQVMPRSDHYRDVLLSANPSLWPSEVLQRWADFLQPIPTCWPLCSAAWSTWRNARCFCPCYCHPKCTAWPGSSTGLCYWTAWRPVAPIEICPLFAEPGN